MATTALVSAAGGLAAQTPSRPGAPLSIRINAENVRLNNYLHDLAGPGALAGVIGGGLLDGLWQREPDAEAVAGRIGAHAARAAVQVSVHHGLAALMHRSTDYQPCDCSGFGPKVEHALRETFTDRRADGSRALSIPRIGASYAGGFASLAWERDRSVGAAALGATMSLGFKALFNIGRELIR